MTRCSQKIARQASATLVLLGILSPTGSHADEGPPRERQARIRDAIESGRSAQISPHMAIRAGMTIRATHKAALKRLARNETCRALFEPLSRDGVEVLASNVYRSARSASEIDSCRLGIAATTVVGSRRILICERFYSLSPRRRTAILIHEAMHTAGLDEAPRDPEALASREITELVRQACSL
jgi:hypothetical protein